MTSIFTYEVAAMVLELIHGDVMCQESVWRTTLICLNPDDLIQSEIMEPLAGLGRSDGFGPP